MVYVMQASKHQVSKTTHLIVLQHGLWGSPNDVGRLSQYFETVFAEQEPTGGIIIVNSKCNERALTYDGIDVCGARLANMIQDKVQQLQEQQNVRVTKLTLVGYSLGGLIIRYAAGKLYVAGFFEQVQPANLITIATPHLGSFKQPTSWLARFFNSQVAIIASRTGMQLMLADADYSVPWLAQQQALHNQAHEEYQQRHGHERQQQKQQRQQKQHLSEASQSQQGDNSSSTQQQEEASTKNQQQQQQQQQQQRQVELPPGIDPSQPVPLLLLMAHPAGPFHKALASFTTRIAAANIQHDTTVPYCTAALCVTNPYEDHPPVSIDPARYPSVVRPATAEDEAERPVAVGKGRLYMFILFLPLFPLFYAYSATKGMLHHRKARKWPLDTDWLQQYSEALAGGFNPFSRQSSRHTSREAGSRKMLQQDQQHLLAHSAAAAASKEQSSGLADDADAVVHATPAVPMLASVAEPSPFAAAAAAAPRSAVGTVGLHSGTDTKQQQQEATSSSSRTAAEAEAVSTADGPQTEDVVLHASGGAMVLTSQLSAQLSRRLTATQVHEHEGIVEAVEAQSWLLQQQQHWMAKQLFDDMPPCIVCERDLSCWKRQSDEASSSTSEVMDSAAAAAAAAQHDMQQQAASGTGTSSISTSTSIAPVDNAHAENSSSSTAGEESIDGQLQRRGAMHNVPNRTSTSGGADERVFLSTGGWHRMDVWTGHIHAHATIIIRDKRYESQSRDRFDYLVNHMSL